MQLVTSATELSDRSIRLAEREVEVCRFTVLAAHLNLETDPSPARAQRTLGKATAQYQGALHKLARELRN
jgi:hypothetical protein